LLYKQSIMRKRISIFVVVLLMATYLQAQVEPNAGTWKTWFISSGKDYRLPAPASSKDEINQVIAAQKSLDAAGRQQIAFWDAGAPNYRWQEIMNKLWMSSIVEKGPLANMLLGVATYDAMVAAWDTKYAYKRPRPFADRRVKALVLKSESPSYPCEHSVAAGVAVTIISHFFPKMADSVKRLAEQEMASRIAAGVAFPSDTKAGFELGKRIAEKEIEQTKDYATTAKWDGKTPDKTGTWKGKFAMGATAGLNKPVVLQSASQFRPGPPPDFANEMAELKNFKQTFSSQANALYHASQFVWNDVVTRKIWENNLQANAPRAARIYAATNAASYDMFVACFDAKYAYWGIRPDQYDTTYHSLVPTPPFPGYPSGHAAGSGAMAELFSYFFPADRAYFEKVAKDCAESRFQAGIHFRTDNEVGLVLGKNVAGEVVKKLKADGADASSNR
jgi:membrane-associated phospholipid phosphatase